MVPATVVFFIINYKNAKNRVKTKAISALVIIEVTSYYLLLNIDSIKNQNDFDKQDNFTKIFLRMNF